MEGGHLGGQLQKGCGGGGGHEDLKGFAHAKSIVILAPALPHFRVKLTCGMGSADSHKLNLYKLGQIYNRDETSISIHQIRYNNLICGRRFHEYILRKNSYCLANISNQCLVLHYATAQDVDINSQRKTTKNSSFEFKMNCELLI